MLPNSHVITGFNLEPASFEKEVCMSYLLLDSPADETTLAYGFEFFEGVSKSGGSKSSPD